MYVMLKSIWDERVAKNIYGFVIGGYYAGISIAFARISGGSMNPARVLGPALFTGHFWSLYVYILGPIFGCVLGSIFYRSAHLSDNKRLTDAPSATGLVMLKPVDLERVV